MRCGWRQKRLLPVAACLFLVLVLHKFVHDIPEHQADVDVFFPKEVVQERVQSRELAQGRDGPAPAPSPSYAPIAPRFAHVVNILGSKLLSVVSPAVNASAASGGASSGGSFVSSYSLSQALLLLLDGADPDSETSRQILEYIFQYGGDASAPARAPSPEASSGVASPSTSGGNAPPDDPLSAMGDINAQSAALASDLLRDTQNVLEIANAVWAKPPYEFSPSYLSTIKTSLGADAKTLTSAAGVNAWVANATHGKIPTIVEEQALQDAAALVVNALYFKGKWDKEFEPSSTFPQPFRLLGAKGEVTVPMMTQTHKRVLHTDTNAPCVAVKIPYKGGAFQAVVVKPRSNTPAALDDCTDWLTSTVIQPGTPSSTASTAGSTSNSSPPVSSGTGSRTGETSGSGTQLINYGPETTLNLTDTSGNVVGGDTRSAWEKAGSIARGASGTGSMGGTSSSDVPNNTTPFGPGGSDQQLGLGVAVGPAPAVIPQIGTVKSASDPGADLWLRASGGVHLSLPRFKLSSSYELSKPLASLGLRAPFQPSGDFAPMFVPNGSTEKFFVSAIFHKVFIEVNEEGTEAAAVSAGVVSVTSVEITEPPVNIMFDSPFIFAVVHEQSGTIAFLGHVTRPEEADSGGAPAPSTRGG